MEILSSISIEYTQNSFRNFASNLTGNFIEKKIIKSTIILGRKCLQMQIVFLRKKIILISRLNNILSHHRMTLIKAEQSLAKFLLNNLGSIEF